MYNGQSKSAITRFVLTHPSISASKYYKVRVYSLNCSLQSAGITITVASGSVPEAPQSAPFVFSYDSTEAMTVKWTAPMYNGGFPITALKVYVDNNELTELNQSLNYLQMTGLTLGTSYKV